MHLILNQIHKKMTFISIKLQYFGTNGIYTGLVGISCGEPPEVEHATLVSQGHLFDDLAQYACEAGYAGSDGVDSWSRDCQSDGMWSQGSTCTSKVKSRQQN